ncbi:MAG: sigma-54 dependent transcriptional regulator [Desulforhabdus sp.]|jgi:two-component system response regulator AtoC|nr:sigma-54 dependent transcriptional regulator [Desulforhabdus sp.]
MKKILIVDDDPSLARTLELYFQGKAYQVSVAENGKQALARWHREQPDLVLLDVQLPDLDGPEVLRKSIEQGLYGDVIMITAFQDTEATLAALRLGAVDYLYKPLDLDALDLLLKKHLLQKKEREKLASVSHLVTETYKPNQIVGRSQETLNVIKAIAQVAHTPASVLIEGETGTGKELVARTIHQESRPEKPFVAINCAAIVGSLLESELFGHEKGAFTGAAQQKTGKLEYAGDGTVFLDEISELSSDVQAKLLRVLQERDFQKVGGVKNIPFRARIIAATNRNLEAMVKERKFREDLYFRLKVFVIRIPPLRDRPEDIHPLTEYFLIRLNRELNRKVVRIPDVHLNALQAYDWPGNVRELENVLRRGVILSHGEVLEMDENWLRKKGPASESRSAPTEGFEAVPKSLDEVEKDHIERVLQYTGGNYGETCRILGVSRPTLRKKLYDYGIKEEERHEK